MCNWGYNPIYRSCNGRGPPCTHLKNIYMRIRQIGKYLRDNVRVEQ